MTNDDEDKILPGTRRERDGRHERWTGSCWAPAGAVTLADDELPPETPIAPSDWASATGGKPHPERQTSAQRAAAHLLRDLLSPVLAFIDRDTDIRRSPAASQAADALRDLLLADGEAGRVS